MISVEGLPSPSHSAAGVHPRTELQRTDSVHSTTSSTSTNGGGALPAPRQVGSTLDNLGARNRRQGTTGNDAGDKNKPVVLESSDSQAEYMRYQLVQSVSQMASDSLSRWEQAASSIGDQLSKVRDIPQTVR